MPTDTSFALVLTGAPGVGAIGETEIRAATGALAGASMAGARWLGAGEAWEAMVELPASDTAAQARRRVAEALAGKSIDVNLIDGGRSSRAKKLLIADMDSTIIGQECIDEMGDAFGIRSKIAAITERAMRGELDFEGALKDRVALLKGLDIAALERIYETRITLNRGARTLLATMRRAGAYTALVSGGFTFFTAKVAERAGFDTNRANELEFAEGRLTGRVVEPILGRQAKLDSLMEFAAKRGLSLAATLAVGDGANDLAMIKASGLGVAFRAKPVVAAEAHAGIVHGDLTALLYLQGFAKADFVAA